MSNKNYTFIPLDDNPALEDEFSGLGHKRSATALVNSIKSANSKSISIGLEGAWGSGKSTVVAIAEEKLKSESKNKYHFLTFDLWAHQGLDFRRAFLEYFLAWSKDHIAKKKHADLEERVLGKTREVTTKNQRQFSIFGYIFLSAIFLLPFFALWLTPFAANFHKSQLKAEGKVINELPWLFEFLINSGHIIAAIILSVVVVGLIIQIACSWLNLMDFRKALDASFSLFLRKSESETVIESIRDGDPTKYEFKKIFLEILAEVQNGKSKVVFVFDNIDRLPESQVQETWSQVRAAVTNEGVNPNSTNVIAIVPYDRRQTLQSFADKKVEDEEKFETNYEREDVFRKTFNTVISVAPPITSDLSGFLNKCLDQVGLAELNELQRYNLFQIYDTYLTEQKTNPTPRQVKSFVNEVGMLWEQWQYQIAIESIAIFTLHRTCLEAAPKSLQNPETIGNRYRHFSVQSVLDKELAALVYNVEPAIAFELLLERDIKRAFLSKDEQELFKLSKAAGFQEQLDGILAECCQEWAESSLDDYAIALKNFVSLSSDSSIYKSSNSHFLNSVKSLNGLKLAQWEDYTDLFLLTKLTKKKSELRTLMRFIAILAKSSILDTPTRDEGRAWIAFIGGFIQQVSETYNQETASQVASSIAIPYSPDFYIGAALDCDEVNVAFNKFSGVEKQNSSEILKAIKANFKTYPEWFSYIWVQLKFLFSNDEKLELLAEKFNIIKTDILSEDNEQELYFKNSVLVASECQGYENIIGDTLADGTLAWHTHKLHEADNTQGIIDALWLITSSLGTKNLPGLQNPNKPPFGDLSASYRWFNKYYTEEVSLAVLQGLADKLLEEKKANEWLASLFRTPNHYLYLNILEQAFLKDNCPTPSFKLFIDNYPTIEERFSKDLTNKLLQDVGNDYTPSIVKEYPIENIPLILLESIKDRQEKTWKKLTNKIIEYIKRLGEGDWEVMLQESNHNRELLQVLAVKIANKIPPNTLLPVLAKYIAQQLEKPQQDLFHLESFLNALPEQSQTRLAQDVLERVKDAPVSGVGTLAVIEALPILAKLIKPAENAEVCVNKLLIPISGELENALELIKAQPTAWLQAMEAVSKETLELLHEHLRLESDANSENILIEVKEKLEL